MFTSPDAQHLAQLGNDLHWLSKKAHRLAEKFDRQVAKVQRLEDTHMVKTPSCSEHDEWQPDCADCYQTWLSSGWKPKR